MSEVNPSAFGDLDMSRLGYAARKTWRGVHNPLKFSRFRWLALGWAIAISTLMLGGGFAIEGDKILLAKGAFIIYGHIPGGLHTHGVIMSILGLAMIVGLSVPLFGNPEPRNWLQHIFRYTAMYYAWSTGLFALAPLAHGGAFSYVAIVTWSTITAIPAILAFAPPPPLVPRQESALVKLALEIGISPEHARTLAERYIHGGEYDSH